MRGTVRGKRTASFVAGRVLMAAYLTTLAGGAIHGVSLQVQSPDTTVGSSSPNARAAPSVLSEDQFRAWLVVVIAAVAAGFALWNARNTWGALKLNARTAQANILSGLLAEYGKDDFRTALESLQLFARTNSEFVKEYARLFRERERLRELQERNRLRKIEVEGTEPVDDEERLKTDAEKANELDSSRRLLARYFSKITTFAREGMLEPQLVSAAFGKEDLKFVVDVLHPIDHVHQQARGKTCDCATDKFFVKLLALHKE